LVMGVNQKQLAQGVEDTPEQQWAKVLTGLLREIDPNVDPNHIYHLPSESAAKETGHDDPTEEGEVQA